MTSTLFDEQGLRKRLDAVYSRMRERAKPKMWKSGKRRGVVRVPGLHGLPFTRQELWDYAMNMIGPAAVQCSYCVAIGRNPNLITMASCVFDHRIPVARGGTWTIDNLIPICADCNTLKGHLSYGFFVGIMRATEKWEDPLDRKAMYACMRTHGVTQRIRFGGKDKPKGQPAPDKKEPALDFEDDF